MRPDWLSRTSAWLDRQQGSFPLPIGWYWLFLGLMAYSAYALIDLVLYVSR